MRVIDSVEGREFKVVIELVNDGQLLATIYRRHPKIKSFFKKEMTDSVVQVVTNDEMIRYRWWPNFNLLSDKIWEEIYE